MSDKNKNSRFYFIINFTFAAIGITAAAFQQPKSRNSAGCRKYSHDTLYARWRGIAFRDHYYWHFIIYSLPLFLPSLTAEAFRAFSQL